jgi:hypothetical protein
MDPSLLTPLDESFGHQLVAPRAVTQHLDPRWAERAYFLLHVDDELTINAGRQLYRHAGHWTVFAAAATPASPAMASGTGWPAASSTGPSSTPNPSSADICWARSERPYFHSNETICR